MATKSKTYINTELEWAEEQLASWKQYVDQNPLHELKDRIKMKETTRGGAMPLVVASIEAQGKFIQETMKNYLSLLEVVDKLRQIEESKQDEARGTGSIPHRMKINGNKDF